MDKGEKVKKEKLTQVEEEKKKALQIAMGQIEKEFGKEAIMRLGEGAARIQVSAISTGILPLDIAIGVGGIPRGRITEIFGPEGSGKTTICLHVIAEAQKEGGIAAFIDAEHAMDPAYARKIGVDVDNLLISQPDSGEQALEITDRLVRSGAVDCIVVDSVAALVPRGEIEGEMGDQVIGMQARLMSQALRKLTSAISRSRTALIFTNQLRHKIGIRFGNPETTPGGLALKFYASLRLDLRRIETLRQAEQITGAIIRAKVVKNKVAPPFKQAEFEMTQSEGVSREASLLSMAVKEGLVEKSGSWFSYRGERMGQGLASAKNYLREHPQIAEEIEKFVREKYLGKEK